MLTKRIIPCLDVRNRKVTKGVRFQCNIDLGDPIEMGLAYSDGGCDELVFYDITASAERRKIILEVVRRTAEEVFMPLTVGGGIRTLEDIRELLQAGADKVSLNTAAVQNPDFVRQASEKFGSQCIVVAIDAKRRPAEKGIWPLADQLAQKGNGGDLASLRGKLFWEVFIHGGRTPTGIDGLQWAKKVEEWGAGEILLTSMDRDGTKEGYDLPLTRIFSDALAIPVIASGGAGMMEHLLEALIQGRASAVLAASIFHFREHTVKEVKAYLKERGVVVRES